MLPHGVSKLTDLPPPNLTANQDLVEEDSCLKGSSDLKDTQVFASLLGYFQVVGVHPLSAGRMTFLLVACCRYPGILLAGAVKSMGLIGSWNARQHGAL